MNGSTFLIDYHSNTQYLGVVTVLTVIALPNGSFTGKQLAIVVGYIYNTCPYILASRYPKHYCSSNVVIRRCTTHISLLVQ